MAVDLKKAERHIEGGTNDVLIELYYRKMLEELTQWRSNVAYMLDHEPKAVRVHEGGAPEEDLIASLAVTFLKLQMAAK